MASDHNESLDTDLDDAANEAVRDVKRGAKRVSRAVKKGAEAVDDALQPRFGTQLLDLMRSVAEDPESTPGMARDLLRDHPLACLGTAVAVGAVAAKLIRAVRSR
jgi:ElaB/YqjD/DUF883 family membrane-anchored ribosome-binding protein